MLFSEKAKQQMAGIIAGKAKRGHIAGRGKTGPRPPGSKVSGSKAFLLCHECGRPLSGPDGMTCKKCDKLGLAPLPGAVEFVYVGVNLV